MYADVEYDSLLCTCFDVEPTYIHKYRLSQLRYSETQRTQTKDHVHSK